MRYAFILAIGLVLSLQSCKTTDSKQNSALREASESESAVAIRNGLAEVRFGDAAAGAAYESMTGVPSEHMGEDAIEWDQRKGKEIVCSYGRVEMEGDNICHLTFGPDGSAKPASSNSTGRQPAKGTASHHLIDGILTINIDGASAQKLYDAMTKVDVNEEGQDEYIEWKVRHGKSIVCLSSIENAGDAYCKFSIDKNGTVTSPEPAKTGNSVFDEERTLTCTEKKDPKMQLIVSAKKWGNNTFPSKAKVAFKYEGHLMAQDDNAGFSDSPFVIGAKIKLPDNDDKTPCIIKIDERFQNADAFLQAAGETVPYGNYTCIFK